MGRIKNLSEEQEKEILERYLNKQESLYKIEKEIHISQYMIEKTLKKYGVKKRTYIEAKQLGRKYKCDDDFFKIPNSNMAYILGLLASDGSISKKENLIAIQLEEKDREILEKIQQITKNTRPIEEYIRMETQHTICSFRVWSKSWKDSLAHYGIIPEKTFKLKPPEFLPKEYIIDYIRGYFDGDGSIYKVDSQNRVFFEIDGASKEEIDWIYDKLVNQYHILLNKKSIDTKSNGTIIYKIKIGNKKELLKLYHLLYDNKELFMQRKKDKFENLLKIPRDSNSLNEE